MLDFRSDLRSALATLEELDGRLRCVYASASLEFCDAENVLLYNVRMSSFARLMNRGVTFERRFAVPEAPAPLSSPALHHHAYMPDVTTTFLHWQVDHEIVAWEGPAPARPAKAADWWWATRASSCSTSSDHHSGRPFALEVCLGGFGRSLSSLLKPLLDGIIAAFHRDSAPDNSAVARLADHLRQGERDVQCLLSEGDAPLGTRALVRPFREGLQWNPADDLCVACTVQVENVSGPTVVKGRLLSATMITA